MPARLGRRALAMSIAAPGRVLAVGRGARGRPAGSPARGPGDLRHPRAGPARPPRARRTSTSSRTPPASPGARRTSPCARRPHRPGGDRLDERLQAARPRRHGFDGATPTCRPRDRDLPELVACSDFSSATPARARAAPDARRDLRTCCRTYFSQAIVTTTRRPASRATRGDHVRDQGDAVRRAGGPDRRHPVQINPPGSANDPPPGSAPRSSGCRCSPPTPTPRCPAADTWSRSPACSRSRWSCSPSTARRAERSCR